MHVGYLRTGPHLQRLLDEGVSTHCLGPLGNSDPRLIWRIHQLIRCVRPDLIQTWLTQMDILGGFVACWSRIPFVLSERTAAEFYTTHWKDRVRVALGKRAAAIVANSKGGIDYWSAQAHSMEQIRCIIPNAVPFDEIEAAAPIESREIASVPFDELVLFAGRMIPIKNLDRLIPALISVLTKRSSTIAVLLGDGPLAEEVVRTVALAGLTHRLRVLPFSDRLFGWLKRASVFVSVSQFEGNPNTVLEAITCGCPLVVSDISAHREFLDEESAGFVSGQSSDSIAAGILDALENRHAALERAERARKRIVDRTTVAVARQYMELYGMALHDKHMVP